MGKYSVYMQSICCKSLLWIGVFNKHIVGLSSHPYKYLLNYSSSNNSASALNTHIHTVNLT